jgi:hypothetical protein
MKKRRSVMDKFRNWLAKVYPSTRDYRNVTERAKVAKGGDVLTQDSFTERMMFYLVKQDPEAFSNLMEEFDDMIGEE